MTREKAINELNDRIKCAEYVDSDYIDSVHVDALKMALSALSVPDTNVGDTISRQAAIDSINDFIRKCAERGYDTLLYYQEGLNHYILNIPAADVRENVKGHWVADRYCSVCDFDKYEIDLCCGMPKNYCPNCGADMRNEA